MTRLKLSDLADDRPVKLTVEVSGQLHRDLVAYSVALNAGQTSGAPAVSRLIPAMIERFIATDRAFSKARRTIQTTEAG